jgi:hypothetical protein
MKDKNGREVPNCVPSSASIDEIVYSINSEFGSSRQVSVEDAYAVARKACSKYSYLGDTEDLTSAILWEVFSYVEYATNGSSEDSDEMAEYAGLLPEGHPDTVSTVISSAAWISGASEFDDSSRSAIPQLYADKYNYVQVLHATNRLKALESSGVIRESTLSYLDKLAKKSAQEN